MKFISILLFCFVFVGFVNVLSAQEKGAITPEVLKQVKSSFQRDDSYKAASNAVSSNDIRKLALNRENVGKVDHEFKYKVDVVGITDQKSSGRCWMFTGLNVLRPVVISDLNLPAFEFSTNYLYFWDQFEKSNLFLEAIINTADRPADDRTVDWLFSNTIGDGGVWNLLVDLVGKYGLVPKDAMPETYNSENTSTMQKLIRRKLREDGILLRDLASSGKKYADLEKEKVKMLGEIYKMLTINLGEPPETFEWRYKDKTGKVSELKKYTPKSFYDEFVKADLSDYVLLMDDPSRDYYKLYEIEYDRNMIDGRNWQFINIPANEIKQFALSSLKEKEPMYFSCDVGKQLNKEDGTLDVNNYDYESLLGVDFGMNKKQRIISKESGSSHGMALVGVDTDANDVPVKWLLENSWGPASGHNGFLAMTDEWFNEYMFRLVVKKKYVDEKTLTILKQKPTMLPPWDPMFMYEE